MRFYAALFRILVGVHAGGFAVALACILRLLLFGEMALWQGHNGRLGVGLGEAGCTKA